MLKIDGKKIASRIIDLLKREPAPEKFLAVFVVGNNPTTESFIKQKEKVAKELKVDFRIYRFDPPVSGDFLREAMRQVVLSSRCGGALLQLPLPEGLNAKYLANVIPFQKDVDVMSERAIGSFYNERSKVLPPSVSATIEILKEAGIESVADKKIAVVGLGDLVGKPIAVHFFKKAKEVFALDKGSDLLILKEADLVILGAGSAHLIKPSMLKKEAGVIDFGYSFDKEGKICGDFDDSFIDEDYLSFYTPNPGGTGPVLVACLFRNFYLLS